MILKIDKAGRIVVPKPMRQRLGLRADMELEAVEQAGGVLLRPAEHKPSMLQVDGLWVHRGTAETGADWNRAIEDVRDERSASLLKG